MVFIRVNSPSPIFHGQLVTFESPADVSQVAGLKVYYGEEAKTFKFADAHGKVVDNFDLFGANALVSVTLDLNEGLAFVQNSDTNAYLEDKFDEVRVHITDVVPDKAEVWIDFSEDASGQYFTNDEVVALVEQKSKEYAYDIKNELLNGAGEAYDTLKELGDLIDENTDAIQALETIATGKADAAALSTHINDVENPHGVTAAQIGAYTKTETDSAIATAIGNAIAALY